MTGKFTLITVTNAGEVNHSRGYETLRMCEQAKSIALTGMTIEENEEADKRYEEWEKERKDRWRAAHPPRVPTEAERKKWAGMMGSTGPHCSIGEDGLLYEWPGSGNCMSGSYSPNEGESVEHRRGSFVTRHRHDIKYAKCVIEPDPPSERGE